MPHLIAKPVQCRNSAKKKLQHRDLAKTTAMTNHNPVTPFLAEFLCYLVIGF